jgi:PIN like domain
MPSKRSSGRRPGAEQPEFLVDRSLGRLAVPEALRALGLTVHTLADVYGEEAAQETEDVEWIRLAAQRGWVVLCKDDRIRRRPAERDALMEGNVRAFCLTNANLGFDAQAAYFRTNHRRIVQAARKPGPYLYGVYKDTIKKLWPAEEQ